MSTVYRIEFMARVATKWSSDPMGEEYPSAKEAIRAVANRMTNAHRAARILGGESGEPSSFIAFTIGRGEGVKS
jgi:hypothetical protein